MIEIILLKISSFIILFISQTHYFGISILMTLESAGIPIPSEIIMPFAGFLVAKNELNFWFVISAGVIGNWLGSLIFYFIGIKIRSASLKWQKLGHFFEKEIYTGDRWFLSYGNWAVFFARLMPVIRTFISLPAGFFKLDFRLFNIFTLIGSFIWSIFLTYIGVYLGANWQSASVYFKKFDFIIFALLIIGLFYIAVEIYKKINNYRELK